MLILYSLIKLCILIFLILLLLFVAVTTLSAGIRYFYTKRITRVGNLFVRYGIKNMPMELYELMTTEAKKTTSFQEVVFLCCRMHIGFKAGSQAYWRRSQRIGREGILEGALVSKDNRHHILTLHLRRKHQRWKVISFAFTEDLSSPVIFR